MSGRPNLTLTAFASGRGYTLSCVAYNLGNNGAGSLNAFMGAYESISGNFYFCGDRLFRTWLGGLPAGTSEFDAAGTAMAIFGPNRNNFVTCSIIGNLSGTLYIVEASNGGSSPGYGIYPITGLTTVGTAISSGSTANPQFGGSGMYPSHSVNSDDGKLYLAGYNSLQPASARQEFYSCDIGTGTLTLLGRNQPPYVGANIAIHHDHATFLTYPSTLGIIERRSLADFSLVGTIPLPSPTTAVSGNTVAFAGYQNATNKYLATLVLANGTQGVYEYDPSRSSGQEWQQVVGGAASADTLFGRPYANGGILFSYDDGTTGTSAMPNSLWVLLPPPGEAYGDVQPQPEPPPPTPTTWIIEVCPEAAIILRQCRSDATITRVCPTAATIETAIPGWRGGS